MSFGWFLITATTGFYQINDWFTTIGNEIRSERQLVPFETSFLIKGKLYAKVRNKRDLPNGSKTHGLLVREHIYEMQFRGPVSIFFTYCKGAANEMWG